MTQDLTIRANYGRRNRSIFVRIWNLIFRRKRKEETIDYKELLHSKVKDLDERVRITESSFSEFLHNLRAAEKSYDELQDQEKEWEKEVNNLVSILKKAQENNEDSTRIDHVNSAVKHAISEQIKVEKRIKAQKQLVTRQQEIKNNMIQSINQLKNNRDTFSHKVEELIARESTAKTQQEIHNHSHNNYTDLLSDFERNIRQQEATAIGLQEMKTLNYQDYTEEDFDNLLALETKTTSHKRLT